MDDWSGDINDIDDTEIICTDTKYKKFINDTYGELSQKRKSKDFNNMDENFYLCLSIVKYFLNPDNSFTGSDNVNFKTMSDIQSLNIKEFIIQILTPYSEEDSDGLFKMLNNFFDASFVDDKLFLQCIYNHFKADLNNYLDLLIKIKILFNDVTSLPDFDTFEHTVESTSKPSSDSNKKLFEKNKTKRNNNEISKAEYIISSSSRNQLSNSNSSSSRRQKFRPRRNPVYNQIQGIHQLLLNKIGDRLHYVMNSPENKLYPKLDNVVVSSAAPVFGEGEIDDESEDKSEQVDESKDEMDIDYGTIGYLLENEMRENAHTNQFKKLFYTILILKYLALANNDFTFESLVSPFDYESFYYAYLILSYIYPEYIDNFEMFVRLDNNKIISERESEYTLFYHIGNALEGVLQGQHTDFLLKILQENLEVAKKDLESETQTRLKTPFGKGNGAIVSASPDTVAYSLSPYVPTVSDANYDGYTTDADADADADEKEETEKFSNVPSIRDKQQNTKFFGKAVNKLKLRERISSRGNTSQLGGNCDSVDLNLMVALLQAKFMLEASHDLNSIRGREAMLGTENIFSVARTDGIREDLYAKIYSTFETIVNDINTSIPQYAEDKLETKFLTDFKNPSTTIDEPTYLSIIIDSIMLHCPERVDDFFYKPVIGFVLRNVVKNNSLYEILREKVKTYYPPDKWYLFMKVKQKGEIRDLYLSVMKKPDTPFNDTTLELYMQDMGLTNNLDFTLQEQAYIDAYNSIFPPNADNDIDNFFDQLAQPYTLKPDLATALVTANQKLDSGTITLDISGNIKKEGSIQTIDVPKLFDPLNKEKPVYGTIVLPDGARISKLYLGYPNTVPIVQPPGQQPGLSSKAFFEFLLETPNPSQQLINTELKALNNKSVEATIDAINTLLSVWIVNPGIDTYQFILENNQIVGITFTSSSSVPLDRLSSRQLFTYTVYIEDLSVNNICVSIISHFKTVSGNAIAARIIEQMKIVERHPNYRYIDERYNMDYQLAIIASFKSFGDEGQRISAEKMNCWLLSSDRPLIAQGLLNGQPVIADLKIPHSAFGPIEEPPSGKIADIYNENGGILSNRRSLISATKPTLQLLEEALQELQETNNLLTAKLGRSDIYKNGQFMEIIGENLSDEPADKSVDYDSGDSQARQVLLNIYQQKEGELTDLISSQQPANQQHQDNVNTAFLKGTREFIGEMKQILIGLEYYSAGMEAKEKTNKCIQYIDGQIDYAIAMSIDTNTYQDLMAYNKGRIHSTKDILDALKNMYDHIDFGPKLFACHSIACEELTKKLVMYREIVEKSQILNSLAKEAISETYVELINIVVELDNEFTEKVKKSLKDNINESQRRPPRNIKPPKNFGEMVSELGELKRELEDIQTNLQNNIKQGLKFLANLITGKKKKTPEERKIIEEKVELEKQERILKEKVRKKTQEELAKVHTKDKTNASSFLAYVNKIAAKVAERARNIGINIKRTKSSGGKRTRKNKQKNQKKYTKHQKKIISKRMSKRQRKNKMHKNSRKK